MATDSGAWRLDIIIMVLYQITLVFSVQLIFVIFLDYMPQTYCTEDNFCYKMRSKCLTDYDPRAENLCPMSLGKSRRNCIVDHKKVFFYSAQYQYQQDCTHLKSFDNSTAMFIGTLLGNIVLGFLADKYGRRLVYFLSILFGVPCLILSALIQDVTAFYVFRVLTGFAIAGTMTVGWTYATEMISPNRRLRLLALANWPNARMIQVGLAYLAQEWKRTTYISASVACLALPILWFLPESPIWLEQKDKYEEASRARKRIRRIGGSDDGLHDPIEITTFEKVTPARVYKDSRLRRSFIVIVFMYFYVGMAVYITDLNGADMTRNLYWGQFLSGFVLSIGQFIIGMSEPYLTGMGRRVLFLVSQSVALACYIIIVVCLYTDAKGSFMYITAYTLAYASQSICLESAYIALVELMPTDVRATVGAIANIFLKVGTVIATLTKNLKYAYEPSLFFINIVLGTLGMIVVFFFLEESREANMKLVGQKAKGTVVMYDDDKEANEVEDAAVTPMTEEPGTPKTEEPGTPKTEDPGTPKTPEDVPTPVKPVEEKEKAPSVKKQKQPSTRKVAPLEEKKQKKVESKEVSEREKTTQRSDPEVEQNGIVPPEDDRAASENSGRKTDRSARKLKSVTAESQRKTGTVTVEEGTKTMGTLQTMETKEEQLTTDGPVPKTKSQNTISVYDNE
ncbi:unnamed protein product [Caenorhabditis sp. 36 PRJEB53466]|nr:unnamed protein product [Caenorhabditis sp. 36 PRJEB53466]